MPKNEEIKPPVRESCDDGDSRVVCAKPGLNIIFRDRDHVLGKNIEQIHSEYDSLGRCPLAEGDIADITDFPTS